MIYTWKFRIDKIVPYNMNSQQRDIISTYSWTLTGTEGSKFAEIGGNLSFFVDDGIDASKFKDITTVTNTDLENWITEFQGADKIAQWKSDLADQVNRLPDDWEIAPIPE